MNIYALTPKIFLPGFNDQWIKNVTHQFLRYLINDLSKNEYSRSI